jgi:methylenetetrahydrofolate dehydrogenase (NADP+)/methenyltetrahydrofolate cyclohydrolase
MSAIILDGKRLSDEIKAEVKKETIELKNEKGIIPGLAFILIGENPGSKSYVKMKGRACEECGFYSITETYPSNIDEQTIFKEITEFNQNPKLHGILVQLPLPEHLDEQKIIESINPEKDVDGLHPVNLGKTVLGIKTFYSCTPFGIQEILKRYNINPSGKHVVIIGRSNIVGKPVANILLQKKDWANAVVTICHTGAKDISYYSKQADILIAAMGKPGIITGEMIKEGAVVIDVGINRVEDKAAKNGYRLVGDVQFDSAVKKASAITPVPGGVGPMTIAMLMKNTLMSAKNTI